MTALQNRFRGCLLGALLGDVIGAAVEAESPGYIRSQFHTLDDILALETVEEFNRPPWRVGRFTDDTQTMLALAEWLLSAKWDDPLALLHCMANRHQGWRRYGSGLERILHTAVHQPELVVATAKGTYAEGGSYGNGGAMRIAPVGLCCHQNLPQLIRVAQCATRATHAHRLGIQGGVLQATAVGLAVRSPRDDFAPEHFLNMLNIALSRVAHPGYDDFEQQLARLAACLHDNVLPDEAAELLGTELAVHKSLPFALYAFLRTPHSYVETIQTAVFAGGDTDTIAALAGAISGALLGDAAVPEPFLQRVCEEEMTPEAVRALADRLLTVTLTSCDYADGPCRKP